MNDSAPALTSGADSILRTADVVGDAWSWLVMREAVLHGVTRFVEFQARLGVPRSTLSARLTQLTAAGLLVQSARPQGTEYRLTDAGRDFTLGIQALKRLGQPDDVGDVVAFLASNEARWINGDTVRVDGGSKL